MGEEGRKDRAFQDLTDKVGQSWPSMLFRLFTNNTHPDVCRKICLSGERNGEVITSFASELISLS